MPRSLAVALVIGLTGAPAQAGLFDGLFAFSEDAGIPEIDSEAIPLADAGSAVGPDAGACIAAIRQAEKSHGIPADLLLAIGLQEAGIGHKGSMTVWPWSLNIEGQGYRFDTRAEAEAFLMDALEQGRQSIDVGCLQINLRWHPGAFPSPAAGFDPARNADYAARFLRGLYLETGDWLEAAGRYHSATQELKDSYQAGVEGHLTRLDGNTAQIDALAGPGSLAGLALGDGVRLDGTSRRMNPLHAPVRTVGGQAQGRYQRTLLALPRSSAGEEDELLP